MDLGEGKFFSILSENTLKIRALSDAPKYSVMVTANIKNDFEEFTGMKDGDVQFLRVYALQMNSERKLEGCVEAYKHTRIDFLNACFAHLRIVKGLTSDRVQQMNREDTDTMVDDCRRASLVFIEVLLPEEETLCAKIFEGLGVNPFPGTFHDYAARLLNFVQAVCWIPPHENLITILALHQALADLLPKVNVYFKSESLETRARDILDDLAKVLTSALSEFPTKVLKSLKSINSADVPALPRYVMKDNLIPMASKYEKSLQELIVWKPSSKSYDLANKIGLDIVVIDGQTTPVSLHFAWIIVNLVYNLKASMKKNFKDKDASLSYRFSMINLGYTVEKIEWCREGCQGGCRCGEGCQELRKLIGDQFLHKLSDRFHLAIKDYLDSVTVKISKSLHTTFLTSKSAMLEQLTTFNEMFDDLHKLLDTIVVSDSQLREKHQSFISKRLVQGYKSFHSRLESQGVVAKYSPELLAGKIKSLFRDAPNSHEEW